MILAAMEASIMPTSALSHAKTASAPIALSWNAAADAVSGR